MGWLRGIQGSRYEIRSSEQSSVAHAQSKQNVEHVEHVEHVEDVNVANLSLSGKNKTLPTRSYPIQASTVSNDKLPFIPAEIVRSKSKLSSLNDGSALPGEGQNYWIVVDDIVYDCTTFVSEHPGGKQVILSFVGEDCSWQFWRFHGKSDMEQYGRPLRIGRTQGVTNRFPEPVRFVGLSKLGSDEW